MQAQVQIHSTMNVVRRPFIDCCRRNDRTWADEWEGDALPASHTRKVLSSLALTRRLPSGDQTTPNTQLECPRKGAMASIRVCMSHILVKAYIYIYILMIYIYIYIYVSVL
jgi:hypothetical protein